MGTVEEMERPVLSNEVVKALGSLKVTQSTANTPINAPQTTQCSSPHDVKERGVSVLLEFPEEQDLRPSGRFIGKCREPSGPFGPNRVALDRVLNREDIARLKSPVPTARVSAKVEKLKLIVQL